MEDAFQIVHTADIEMEKRDPSQAYIPNIVFDALEKDLELLGILMAFYAREHIPKTISRMVKLCPKGTRQSIEKKIHKLVELGYLKKVIVQEDKVEK